MKTKNLPLKIYLAIFLITGLSSCCDNSDISGNNGFSFFFNNGALIQKIELVGAGKTITYNTKYAHITLNPADSVSKYKIYDNAGNSGSIEIAYTSKLVYLDKGCKETTVLDIVHSSRVIYSTYTKVEIKGGNERSNYKDTYVEITP